MQWIANLKQHAPQMQRDIQRFCEEYSGQDFQEQQCVEGLLRSTGNFEAWVRALPSDDAVWPWVDWPTTLYDAKVSLTAIEGYFGLLLTFNEETGFSDAPQPLTPHAQITRDQINRVLSAYHQGRTQHEDFSRSREAGIESVPPYIVLYALWPFVYPWCLDRAMDLRAFEIKTWPAVLYHPHDTPTMLQDIIGFLARTAGYLLIIPRRNDAFEICVTHPNLLMTPTLWETLTTRLRPGGRMEHLREIGGSIEPLTWDEGLGQGVIIRLPWAKA